MSVVVEFQELVRRRERRHVREMEQRCVEIIALNLAYYEARLGEAPTPERALLQRRTQQFADLLTYVSARIGT